MAARVLSISYLKTLELHSLWSWSLSVCFVGKVYSDIESEKVQRACFKAPNKNGDKQRVSVVCWADHISFDAG